MLEEPILDPALAEADRAVAEAVARRLALGPASGDAAAIALRPLLEGLAPVPSRAVRAVLGRIEAADRPTIAWGAAATVLAADRHGADLRAAPGPEAALAEAARGARAILDIAGKPWWGRLLAMPGLRVVAALPDDVGAPPRALAVEAAQPLPTGQDRTFWITDSGWDDVRIVNALGHAGLAAEPLAAAGGLKLFMLAGYVQVDDPRLTGAPGSLSGVIGAAPAF